MCFFPPSDECEQHYIMNVYTTIQRVQNEDPRKESSFLVYCNTVTNDEQGTCDHVFQIQQE